MFLPITKSLRSLLKKLEDANQPTLSELHATYFAVLKLRSQLLGAIDTMEHYGTSENAIVPLAQQQAHGKTIDSSVVLTIDEPLPQMKELTADLHEHWLELIHTAMKQAQNGLNMHRCFNKAFVMIVRAAQKKVIRQRMCRGKKCDKIKICCIFSQITVFVYLL